MILNDELYFKIKALSKQGENLSDLKHFQPAIIKYEAALALVPKPCIDWEASTWLYTAIGDCYYFLREYQQSIIAFENAFNCPNGNKNPFINLRIGQCFFDLQEFEKAEKYLMKAYMLDGLKIFKGEPAKYLNHLKKIYTL